MKNKTYRDIPLNEVEAYADKKALNIETEENFREARIALFNEKRLQSLKEELRTFKVRARLSEENSPGRSFNENQARRIENEIELLK